MAVEEYGSSLPKMVVEEHESSSPTMVVAEVQTRMASFEMLTTQRHTETGLAFETMEVVAQTQKKPVDMNMLVEAENFRTQMA